MNTWDELLTSRNFSDEEKKEVEQMMSSIKFHFDKEPSTVNFLAVASFQADTLSIFGTTPKVKELASQMYQKIKKFL